MSLLVFSLVLATSIACAAENATFCLGISVSKATSRSAEVRWEVDNYPMPQHYDLLKLVCSGINVYRDTQGNLLMDHSVRSQFFPAKSGYGVLEELSPYSNYTCNAYANRDIDSFEFHTSVAAPVPPKQPNVTKSESNHHWKYIIDLYNTSTLNGPITGYEVQFHCIDGIPMDTLTSHAQEQKYMPFKDNIPTALEAQQSVKPTSFYLRAHRIPLPDTIVVNQKLLHGAIKKDSAYIIVVAAYSHNEHGHLLYSHSPPSRVISMPSKYVVKNDHVIPDPRIEAPSAVTDILEPMHTTQNHYVERTIVTVLLSILPVVTLLCLLCICLVLCTSKGKRRRKKKQNKEEYELEKKRFLSPSLKTRPTPASQEIIISSPQKAFNVTSSFYDTFSSDPTNFVEDEYDLTCYHSTNPFLAPPPTPPTHSPSSTKKSSSTPPVCPPRRSSLTPNQQGSSSITSPICPPRRSSLTKSRETAQQSSSPLARAVPPTAPHSSSHSTSHGWSGSSNFVQITEEAFVDLTSQKYAAHQNATVATQTPSELSSPKGQEMAGFDEVASPSRINSGSTLPRNGQYQTRGTFSETFQGGISSPVPSLPCPPPPISYPRDTHAQVVMADFKNSSQTSSSQRTQPSQSQMSSEAQQIASVNSTSSTRYASQGMVHVVSTHRPANALNTESSLSRPESNQSKQSALVHVMTQTTATQSTTNDRERPSIASHDHVTLVAPPFSPGPGIVQQQSTSSSSYSEQSNAIEYNTSGEIAMYTEPYTETGSVRLLSTDPNPHSITESVYVQSDTLPSIVDRDTSKHPITRDEDTSSEEEVTPPLMPSNSSYNTLFSSSSSSTGPQSDHAPDLELQFSDLLLPVRPSLSLRTLLSASPDVELNGRSQMEFFHHDSQQSIENQASANESVQLGENNSTLHNHLVHHAFSAQGSSDWHSEPIINSPMPQYSSDDSSSIQSRYSEDIKCEYIATPVTTNRNTINDDDFSDSDPFSEVPALQKMSNHGQVISASPHEESPRKIQPLFNAATRTLPIMPPPQRRMKEIETQTSYKRTENIMLSSSSADTFTTIKPEQSLPSLSGRGIETSIETQHYFVNPIRLRRAIQGLMSSSSDSCSVSSSSSNEIAFTTTNIHSGSASPAEPNIPPFVSSSLESFVNSPSVSTGGFVTPQSSMDDGFCTPSSSRNHACTTPEGSTHCPFISPSCSAHASNTAQCLYTTPEYYLANSEDYDLDIKL